MDRHVSSDGMVTVEIGSSKTKYLVHKALIVYHSEYFHKALSGPWTEAEERVVTLADVGEEECKFGRGYHQNNTDISLVNLFVHWLYTQQIPTGYLALRSVVHHPDSPKAPINKALVLVKAYALGDRILALTFRREANNTLIIFGSCMGFPSTLLPTATYAFANIPSDRSILQFLVNQFCKCWDPEYIINTEEDALSELPPAFTVRAMKRLAHLRCGKLEGCYIEHSTNEEKKSCREPHMEFVGGEFGYGYFGELKIIFAVSDE
ncbi:hypothetical protein N0V86_005981 [Didymella sp. IMI 355093]|nr:hypothetical protein N0V86_005981 [Didymella sp. IMI 355093]